MENNQPSSFLDAWHFAMLAGAIGMAVVGIAILIGHFVALSSKKTPKEKHDFASRREIKNLEIVFICFAIGVALLINRYGMDKLDEMGVWFFGGIL